MTAHIELTYKLSTQGQGALVLTRSTGAHSSETVGLIHNSPKGWHAFHAQKTDRVSSLGPVFEPIGDGVQVSRLVNQHNGGDLIAEALGL